MSSDTWDSSTMINFLDGLAFALAPDLRTVCLGKETVLNVALETGKVPEDFPSLKRQILQEIIDFRREIARNGRADAIKPQSNRKLRAVKTRNQRVRPAAAAKHRTKYTKCA